MLTEATNRYSAAYLYKVYLSIGYPANVLYRISDDLRGDHRDSHRAPLRCWDESVSLPVVRDALLYYWDVHICPEHEWDLSDPDYRRLWRFKLRIPTLWDPENSHSSRIDRDRAIGELKKLASFVEHLLWHAWRQAVFKEALERHAIVPPASQE